MHDFYELVEIMARKPLFPKCRNAKCDLYLSNKTNTIEFFLSKDFNKSIFFYEDSHLLSILSS